MGSRSSHLALYPGSFDPITLGHLDVLQRARRMFDEIVLGVGQNPEKQPLFSAEERVEMNRELVAELVDTSPGAPVRVESYSGLTMDFARELEASVILRGIRNVTDLAAECQLAITNRQVANVETVFVVTGEQFAFTSSSLIRQVAAFGGDLDKLKTTVPPLVLDRLKQTLEDPIKRALVMPHDRNID